MLEAQAPQLAAAQAERDEARQTAGTFELDLADARAVKARVKRELAESEATVARLREELTDWQLVADGVKHHFGCPNNATTGTQTLDEPCLRCQVESVREAARRPKVICLCGSTRFIEQFAIKTWELELEGHIVLGCTLLPTWYCEVPHHFAEHQGVKGQRDEHHLRKIDMADEVLVLNVGGYIGESTRNEIAYAERTGKPVNYLERLRDAAPVPQGRE